MSTTGEPRRKVWQAAEYASGSLLITKQLFYCRKCKVYFAVATLPECPQHRGVDHIQRIRELK